MNQIKLMITSARAKEASSASDTDRKVAISTGDTKSATTTDTPLSASSSDSLDRPCPSLTKQQRFTGFIACFGLGLLINVGSSFALIGGLDHGPKFGVTYSLGNVIALCGSGFLAGPKQQVKLMFQPVRRLATISYLVMIVIVLIVAIVTPQLGLVVLFLVFVQSTAAVWYSASYIPYGRTILTGIAKKVCGTAV